MMTREMTWMGFLATVLIAVVLAIAAAREPDRQQQAAIDLRIESVIAGINLYAENCAVCHGAAGEGLGTTPALNNDGLRAMDAETIAKTIARGRYGTVMAAYNVDEGGVFTNAEIDQLVSVIQDANWKAVAARVDALGLTPPEAATVELTEETLASVRSLPDGETLANGLQIYATECAACHGANAEGTNIAPVLNSADLRATSTDDDLARIIAQGVPGTLMAGWSRTLTSEEIAEVVMLIQRWPELESAGVGIPVIEAAPVDMSPEAIALGARLFSLACAQCHGAQSYGTPMAPALNNQTFLEATSDAAIGQIIAGGVPGTVMPAWGGRLSEADIAALTAFLRSLETTAPAIARP